MRRPSNLGATRLRRRSRAEDPMRTFDTLPRPLRRWLAEAAMPWSPASCRRIWMRARSEGEPVEDILARLDRAEKKCLGLANDPFPPRVGGQTSHEHESP
ncbi:DUF6525 family protein [Paracoccus seriniphilus]|uniref:DUF6525 family protein n=1 Tax=Paracoccus seriniphilus TaxID=184748 RepID=UPI0035639F2A